VRPYADALTEDLRGALDGEDWRTAEQACDELDRIAERPAVPLVSAALWYAEHGLPVFPIQPGAKEPHRGTHGVLDASLDPATITQWWATWPDSNVGIATGHVADVVDFDGLAGHAAWGREFGETWGGLDVLGTVSTPRPGGMHLYATAMPNTRNRAKMMPGVDYRGAGGYVLAPPSVLDDRPGQHPGTYRWLRPLAVDR